MRDATIYQIRRAESLGIDVFDKSYDDARLIINSELRRRRKVAMEALEAAGLKEGVLCLYGDIKIRFERFFERKTLRFEDDSPPQMVTREVRSGKPIFPTAISVQMLGENDEMIPVNTRDLWYSFFTSKDNSKAK